VLSGEKGYNKVDRGLRRATFSGPVKSKSCGIAAISSDFQGNPARFLCSADWLAEEAVWR